MLEVEIKQGSEETSAPISELGFKVELLSYDSENIKLKLIFENPLSISSGEKADTIKIYFLKPELFISKESGKTVKATKVLYYRLPKQFPDVSDYEFTVVAGDTT